MTVDNGILFYPNASIVMAKSIHSINFVSLFFRTAKRTDSYNQGVIVTHRPLKENEMFEVKLDRLSNRWTSSLMIGALFEAPEKIHLPVTALGFKKNAIVLCGGKLLF